MAENKKSFVLYADLIHTLDQLPDDKAGLLFKHILKYVNDMDPKTEDLIVKVSFEPIKQQLKRDLIKWDNIRAKRSESGKLGGRPKKQTKAKKANALFEKQTKAKKAVNDNVNVNVINILKESDLEPLFMQLQIDASLMDKYLNEFILKLTLEPEEKTESEAKKWFINWLKQQPKKNLKYLTDEEKDRRQVPREWTYIFWEDTYKKVHEDNIGQYIEYKSEKIYL